MPEESNRLSTRQRTLLLVVIAARNAGITDVTGAVLAAVRHPPPSPQDVAALVDLLDSEAVAYQPGEPAQVVITRVAGLLGEHLA
ncbi:hypothetical protein [Nocardia sp. NPDC127526]|uniref:hypothetical protein n=1 Tax=Nocardia sp. NPDC127526 TaxID=3345393 RepID=UPI003636819F